MLLFPVFPEPYFPILYMAYHFHQLFLILFILLFLILFFFFLFLIFIIVIANFLQPIKQFIFLFFLLLLFLFLLVLLLYLITYLLLHARLNNQRNLRLLIMQNLIQSITALMVTGPLFYFIQKNRFFVLRAPSFKIISAKNLSIVQFRLL